jgi:hypothetical protein
MANKNFVRSVLAEHRYHALGWEALMTRLVSICALFLVPLAAVAQRNTVTVYAIGNLNTWNFTYIPSAEMLTMPAHNRSSLGGGVEYVRRLTAELSAGVWFETNPSDGALLLISLPSLSTPQPNLYLGIWPLERYEFFALLTEHFRNKARWQPFLQEGFGFIVTQSLVKNSGWSEDPAPAYGGGVAYRLSPHCKAKLSMLVETARTGCYGDPACTNRGSFAIHPSTRSLKPTRRPPRSVRFGMKYQNRRCPGENSHHLNRVICGPSGS